MLFSRRSVWNAFSTRVGSPVDFDKCMPRHVRPSGLLSRKRRTHRINPISSSHEQRRTLLLESAMSKYSRRFSVQKLWSPCTWYSRYLLVLVFRLLLGIISGYTRLLPDKEAPDSHYNRLPTAAIHCIDKIMHTASDYMCIQFCVITPTMLCLGRTREFLSLILAEVNIR